MYQAITYCLAASFALAVSAHGSFTSPPWPSTNAAYSTGTNKDTRLWQVYSSIVERVEAIGTTNYAEPQFYIYERAECIRFKAWVTNNCQYFLNTTAAVGGSYDAWFAAHPGQPFPMWTVTGIVAHLNLPTNYFTQTPWQQLSGNGWEITNAWTYTSGTNAFSELDYGWQYAPTIFSVLVWTTFDPNWRGVVASETVDCAVECDTRDLDFLPIATSEACSVSIDMPTNGFDYISGLDQNQYEITGEGQILLLISGAYEPDCEQGGFGQWFFSSRDTETLFEQTYAYAMTYAHDGPHISNVSVEVDYYGALGAWQDDCTVSTGTPLIRYTTVLSTTGNWNDTSGNLGASFGEDWESNRVFMADELWPQSYDPPQFDAVCANSGIEETPSPGSSCTTEEYVAFSNCFPGMEFESFFGSVGGGRFKKTHVFQTERENTGAAVLKWDFSYR